MMRWLFWQVPDERVNHYIFFMFVAIFVLPWLMNVRFTSLGYFLNIVWLDIIYYWSYRFSQKINRRKDDKDGNDTF